MSSIPPNIAQGLLPTSTIVPRDNEAIFITYLTRLYEDIAIVVNGKDSIYFTMSVTDVAQNIPNVANFGSFIIAVSGQTSTLPTKTASLCKADSTAAGSITGIGSQVGTGSWAGNTIIISSTATNFQIRHDRTGVSGNFNVRIIGTQ